MADWLFIECLFGLSSFMHRAQCTQLNIETRGSFLVTENSIRVQKFLDSLCISGNQGGEDRYEVGVITPLKTGPRVEGMGSFQQRLVGDVKLMGRGGAEVCACWSDLE